VVSVELAVQRAGIVHDVTAWVKSGYTIDVVEQVSIELAQSVLTASTRRLL
jgi:hypothetical protein